jgi:hypothetical protein
MVADGLSAEVHRRRWRLVLVLGQVTPSLPTTAGDGEAVGAPRSDKHSTCSGRRASVRRQRGAAGVRLQQASDRPSSELDFTVHPPNDRAQRPMESRRSDDSLHSGKMYPVVRLLVVAPPPGEVGRLSVLREFDAELPPAAASVGIRQRRKAGHTHNRRSAWTDRQTAQVSGTEDGRARDGRAAHWHRARSLQFHRLECRSGRAGALTLQAL